MLDTHTHTLRLIYCLRSVSEGGRADSKDFALHKAEAEAAEFEDV